MATLPKALPSSESPSVRTAIYANDILHWYDGHPWKTRTVKARFHDSLSVICHRLEHLVLSFSPGKTAAMAYRPR